MEQEPRVVALILQLLLMLTMMMLRLLLLRMMMMWKTLMGGGDPRARVQESAHAARAPPTAHPHTGPAQMETRIV